MIRVRTTTTSRLVLADSQARQHCFGYNFAPPDNSDTTPRTLNTPSLARNPTRPKVHFTVGSSCDLSQLGPLRRHSLVRINFSSSFSDRQEVGIESTYPNISVPLDSCYRHTCQASPTPIPAVDPPLPRASEATPALDTAQGTQSRFDREVPRAVQRARPIVLLASLDHDQPIPRDIEAPSRSCRSQIKALTTSQYGQRDYGLPPPCDSTPSHQALFTSRCVRMLQQSSTSPPLSLTFADNSVVIFWLLYIGVSVAISIIIFIASHLDLLRNVYYDTDHCGLPYPISTLQSWTIRHLLHRRIHHHRTPSTLVIIAHQRR